jgi:hypothetical protein
MTPANEDERLTEAELAILRHDSWHQNIDSRMGTFETNVKNISGKLDTHIASTDSIKADTAELLALFRSWKGAMTVAGWFSKPITWMATTFAALLGAYAAWRAMK